MAYNYEQGKYSPVHKNKYRGSYPIIYRSSWEKKAFMTLDKNPKIEMWSSESVVVKYKDPTRNDTVHRYFVDLAFKLKLPNGKLQEYWVEIKPYSQTVQPKRGHKKETTFLKESVDYARNMSKWKYAMEAAHRRGIKFLIWTEKDIFAK